MSHSPMYRRPHRSVADYLGDSLTLLYLEELKHEFDPPIWSTGDPYTFKAASATTPATNGYIKYKRIRHWLRFDYDGVVTASVPEWLPEPTLQKGLQDEFEVRKNDLPVPCDITDEFMSSHMNDVMRDALRRGSINVIPSRVERDGVFVVHSVQVRMPSGDPKYLRFYWLALPGAVGDGRWVCGERRL